MSEIVELEENNTEAPSFCLTTQHNNQQDSRKKLSRQNGTERLLSSYSLDSPKTYTRSNSLPNGDLNIGSNRIVYKNGHFVIETEFDQYEDKENAYYDEETNLESSEGEISQSHSDNCDLKSRTIEMGKLKRISYSEPQLCDSGDDSMHNAVEGQYPTVKWVIFVGCNFRYIHDLLMDSNSTPREILLNYITHTVHINSLYI